MRRVIMTLLALICFINLPAQTIHWITFIDTTDSNVGEIDKKGRTLLYEKFINIVNEALRYKGYKSKIYDFYGYETSPENCKDIVEKLTCGEKDIVMFYYIGHGARPVGDYEYNRKNPWPQMLMAQHEPKKCIPMHWVHEKLKSKGARLTVTIGMCCNSATPYLKHKDEPESMSKRNRLISKSYAKRIQKWFLNTTGDVEVTSSSPLQTSGAFVFSEWGVIDLFTGVIALQMNDYRYNDNDITWYDFLYKVKDCCDEFSRYEQTPYYEINLK